MQVIEDKDEADYNISILVLEPKINSTAVGYFSVSIVTSPGIFPFHLLNAVKLDTAALYAIAAEFKKYREVRDHLVRSGPGEHLRSDCEQLVAELDTQYFDFTRVILKNIRAERRP